MGRVTDALRGLGSAVAMGLGGLLILGGSLVALIGWDHVERWLFDTTEDLPGPAGRAASAFVSALSGPFTGPVLVRTAPEDPERQFEEAVEARYNAELEKDPAVAVRIAGVDCRRADAAPTGVLYRFACVIESTDSRAVGVTYDVWPDLVEVVEAVPLP